MKKTLLILMLLMIPSVLACDMGGSGATGAATADTCPINSNYNLFGFGMMGPNYLGLILLLYFIVGLGYVIYKINKIEAKIRRK